MNSSRSASRPARDSPFAHYLRMPARAIIGWHPGKSGSLQTQPVQGVQGAAGPIVMKATFPPALFGSSPAPPSRFAVAKFHPPAPPATPGASRAPLSPALVSPAIFSVYPSISAAGVLFSEKSPLCFHTLTNIFPSNSFVFTPMQKYRGMPAHRPISLKKRNFPPPPYPLAPLCIQLPAPDHLQQQEPCHCRERQP